MKKPLIQIEVVSDVVCPWCYIGKRRMEKAVDHLKDQYDFTITFSPFELNPDVPKAGINQKDHLMKKFGGEARYNQITTHVTQIAAGEGLQFDFDSQNISPNTRDAHRIIWLARKEGKQAVVKEAFMKAYFEDGVDLSNPENLIEVAQNVGLDPDKVESLLGSETGLAEVESAEQLNRERGISGVPFFIVNNKYGISGAQSSEVFVKSFTEISDREGITS